MIIEGHCKQPERNQAVFYHCGEKPVSDPMSIEGKEGLAVMVGQIKV